MDIHGIGTKQRLGRQGQIAVPGDGAKAAARGKIGVQVVVFAQQFRHLSAGGHEAQTDLMDAFVAHVGQDSAPGAA